MESITIEISVVSLILLGLGLYVWDKTYWSFRREAIREHGIILEEDASKIESMLDHAILLKTDDGNPSLLLPNREYHMLYRYKFAPTLRYRTYQHGLIPKRHWLSKKIDRAIEELEKRSEEEQENNFLMYRKIRGRIRLR